MDKFNIVLNFRQMPCSAAWMVFAVFVLSAHPFRCLLRNFLKKFFLVFARV